jgi:hypothetical protein
MKKDAQKGAKNYSLKLRFTVFFVLFIVAVYSVVIITAALQVVLVSETLGMQLGLPIVEEAARIIDGDAFEALSKSLDPEDPYYEKTRLELLAIKEKTKAIYLYTITPVEGSVFRYIIDGNEDTDEGFSPLGTEEDISSYLEPVLKAMQTKTCQISTVDIANEWGWLISVFLPIVNSSGAVVGIIGCDFVPEDIFTRLWSQIIWEVILAGVFAILGIAAYLYLVNGINRQNRHLVELKEAAEAASAALKEERDKVVIMKDRLLAEMRAFMELLSVNPDDFRAFTSETEMRCKEVNAILSAPEISPVDVLRIHRNVQSMEEKAGQAGLKTFADNLHNLAAGIEKLREKPAISFSDKTEIPEHLRKIMKAVNDSQKIIKKIQAFRSGDAQLRDRGSA